MADCLCIYAQPKEGNSRRVETLELPQDPAKDPLNHQPEERKNRKNKVTHVFNFTSDRKLERVGFSKSVFVTFTFEEKFMSI